MPRFPIRDEDGNIKGYIDTDEPYDPYNPPQNPPDFISPAGTVDHTQAILHLVLFSVIIAFVSWLFEKRIGCGFALVLLAFTIGYAIFVFATGREKW